MLPETRVQEQLQSFVCVEWLYDGLGGKVIAWTLEHGNTNHDPSVLAWILDPDGKEVSRPGAALGSPQGFADWLAEHSSASFPLVDPSAYAELRAEAEAIAARRKLGSTVATLRELAGGEESPRQQEAERLLAAILPYAQWKLERARQLERDDPPAALATYAELAKELQGDELGTRAKETRDRLRKDPAFKDELKAFTLLQRAGPLLEELRPCKPRQPLDLAGCPDCQKQNRKVLGKVVPLLQSIRVRYPDTAAAGRATARLQEWGLLAE